VPRAHATRGPETVGSTRSHAARTGEGQPLP
jgi:hypothetical protein